MSWLGLPERIERKVQPEPNSGCWLWTGTLNDDGYGVSWYENRKWSAHRMMFYIFKGYSPKGLTLDHRCRMRCCCNPDHLTPRTWKANIHLGEGIAAKNIKKTHCPKGHPYSETNTYFWNNQRFCRTCSAIYKQSYEQRVGRFRVRKKA